MLSNHNHRPLAPPADPRQFQYGGPSRVASSLRHARVAGSGGGEGHDTGWTDDVVSKGWFMVDDGCFMVNSWLIHG